MVSRVKVFLGAMVFFAVTGVFANDTFANNVDMTVQLEPSTSITISSASVNLTINPTASGTFDSDSLTVDFYSNSPAGVRFGMTTESTTLVSDTYSFATESYPTIPTLSQNVTVDTFEMNKWGVTFEIQGNRQTKW